MKDAIEDITHNDLLGLLPKCNDAIQGDAGLAQDRDDDGSEGNTVSDANKIGVDSTPDPSWLPSTPKPKKRKAAQAKTTASLQK